MRRTSVASLRSPRPSAAARPAAVARPGSRAPSRDERGPVAAAGRGEHPCRVPARRAVRGDDPAEHAVGARLRRQLHQPGGVPLRHRALVDDAVQQQRPERVVGARHGERTHAAAARQQRLRGVGAQRGPQPVHREVGRGPELHRRLEVQLEEAVARGVAHVTAVGPLPHAGDGQEPGRREDGVEPGQVGRGDEQVDVARRVGEPGLAAEQAPRHPRPVQSGERPEQRGVDGVDGPVRPHRTNRARRRRWRGRGGTSATRR